MIQIERPLPRKQPRILYVSPPWPYQAIRSRHLARALREVGEVTIGVVHSEGERWETNYFMEREFPIAFEWEAKLQPRRNLLLKYRATIDPAFPYPHGLGMTEDSQRHLDEKLCEFDIVWFFKLRTANMFSRLMWEKSVLDIDDLPSGYHRTVLRSVATLRQRLATCMEIFRWKRREALLDQRFLVLATCSEADSKYLKAKVPVHTIPNGFERPSGAPDRRVSAPPRIGFVGLFDYIPNYLGMKWFVENCWPLVKATYPDARLRMMGRGSESAFRCGNSDIDGLGWVEDPASEIATWSVMIVPVKIGGGTRVKIAEGFSRKCPIVSTSIGAYGYDVRDGHQLRLADSAADFALACVDIVRDPEKAARMAERAWSEFLEKWTWEAIAPRVWSAAEDCLRRCRVQGGPTLI